jgi:curli biogenesis system outer membrane secretion channel CsgG
MENIFTVQSVNFVKTRNLPLFSLLCASLILLVAGCATESHRALTPETVPSSKMAYQGLKHVLVVGKFQNRSAYMRGIFSDGFDQLGSQAKTILKTHLQQSGRFDVVDRENMDEIALEAKLRGAQQQLHGAQVVLTGDVTEFGRRTTGDTQLFGILGYGKQQVAYTKVALNVVDVKTSRIIYSVQGAGEYELSNREIIGFGSTAGYDATLNGKVLNLAIMEAVNNLVNGLERGEWNPSLGR